MTSIQVTVPGKIMIAGEYAVLHGAPALAHTTSTSMEVVISPTANSEIRACSFAWREPQVADLSEALHSHEFLLKTAAQACKLYGVQGMEISITRGYPSSYGFGSSSALAIAAFAGAAQLSGRDESPMTIARHAWELQKQHQGFASGYDVATQTLGGLTLFRHDGQHDLWPSEARVIPDLHDKLPSMLQVFVGGRGADTRATVRDTMATFDRENLWTHWLASGRTMVRTFLQFLQTPADDVAWHALLEANRSANQLARRTPAFPELLRQMQKLPGCDRTWGCKTTGAGGEDALLLFGAQEVTESARELLHNTGWTALTNVLSTNSWSIEVNS